MKNPVKSSRFLFPPGVANILPWKQRAWQSNWMLCISPRRDLLVRDPADTASSLGISVGDVHNPDTVSLPLMLCWDLRGGCRGAKGGSCISVSSATQTMKTASLQQHA